MKKQDWKERLGVVYSTNPDFQYETAAIPETATLPPAQQTLRVQMERKGRGGKTVTVVNGFVGSEADLAELARLLKNRCGVGGSAKDGVIVVQGNLRDKVVTILQAAGYARTK